MWQSRINLAVREANLLHCTITRALDVSFSVANVWSQKSGLREASAHGWSAQVIYEIRVYEAADGKAEAMRSRFKNEVIPRMPRHGIELVGAFVSPVEDGKLTYLTRFDSEEARQKSWASFGADPEWKAVKAASEADGPLLRQQTVTVLSPAWSGLQLQ
jgi:hypothetical protein